MKVKSTNMNVNENTTMKAKNTNMNVKNTNMNVKENSTMNTKMNTCKNTNSNGMMVFGKNTCHSMDTRMTRRNNNVLVVGCTGSGKTGSYVEPNVTYADNSLVIADTKGQLYFDMKDELKERGFDTYSMDFVHPERSAPFNPLDSVKRFRNGTYREMDLAKIAAIMIPDNRVKDDTFWVDSARTVLVSLMAFTLETLPRSEQHFGSVIRLYRELSNEIAQGRMNRSWEGVSFFLALERERPDSLAVKMYRNYSGNFPAEKCWGSIEQFVSNALKVFDYAENRKMFCRKGFDLTRLGKKKTALFINTSDTDRSMDDIVNIFYTQLFQVLCEYADSRVNYRLPVPVHIIMDDFAANVCIPDFDKIISVIRSREISTSIMLQSISQLDGMYSRGQASTIINNCDSMLYLGGKDLDTIRFFAEMAGKVSETIGALDNDHAWLFVRGEEPRLIEKLSPYDFKGTLQYDG